MARVSIKNVSKVYPSAKPEPITVLDDVSLEVDDGEFAVLAGPPGCGKSTILRMIAGLEQVSKGDIFLGDRRVNEVPAKDREIAMVFRDDALYPNMSAYDNMAFGLKRRDFSKAEIEKRVREAAAILGLDEVLELKPSALDRVQRQRAAIGRAMVRQPRVWLFDEPLLNLDGTQRVDIRTEITKLHQRLGATMIYGTGDSIEALAMGDRLVVMNNGAVQQNGAPSALYREPANLFVAGFLGRPPMNLIHGELKRGRDSLLFSEREGGTIEIRLPASEWLAAQEFVGKPVVLGIRPEEIQVNQSTQQKGAVPGGFAAIVEVVEPMGAETNLYLSTGAHSVVCRSVSPFDQKDSGRRMQFEIDVPKVHLFDSMSLRRLI